MKTGIITLITATIILSGCSATSKSSRKEKVAADFERSAALIESGTYMFTIRSATPSGGRSKQITSLYTLEAREGEFRAHLPYFGRAYSGGYGDGGGVEFNGKAESLKVSRNDDKNTIVVEFTIDSSNGSEKHDVRLNIGATAYGNLVITSNRRQTISYYGMAGELND